MKLLTFVYTQFGFSSLLPNAFFQAQNVPNSMLSGNRVRDAVRTEKRDEKHRGVGRNRRGKKGK